MTGVTRWGIVGTGGIARRVIEDLRLVGSIEVIAAASRTQEGADAFCAETGVPRGYGDYGRMLEDADVEVVYVCTPHPQHFEYARRAILAGKHVLVEKPMVLELEHAVTLRDLAAERGVFLMEAMWTKFNPNVRSALDYVAGGGLGEPKFAQTSMGGAIASTGPKRFWDPALGGGALWDLGVYTLTFAQEFLGVPESISAVGEMQDDGVDRWASVTLRYPNGGVGIATCSIVFALPPTAVIGGMTGTIAFEGPFFCPTAYTVTKGRVPVAYTEERFSEPVEGHGYVHMFRAVSEAVLAGQLEHPWHPVASTIDVLRTMSTARGLLGPALANGPAA